MSDLIRSQFFLPFVVAATLVVALCSVLYRTWRTLRELRLRQQETSQLDERWGTSSDQTIGLADDPGRMLGIADDGPTPGMGGETIGLSDIVVQQERPMISLHGLPPARRPRRGRRGPGPPGAAPGCRGRWWSDP